MIVTQAREPLFYRDLGVPDTVNGRFDLLVLHLWMVLRRLQPMEGGAELSPGAVRPLLRGYGRQFARNGGRRSHRAQSACRPSGRRSTAGRRPTILLWPTVEEPLAQALCKNILDGEQIENARRLAVYAEAAIDSRSHGLDDAALLERIVEISARQRAWACSNEQKRHEHDRQAPIPGAFPSSVAQIPEHRTASRHRSRPGDARGDGGGRRACAKFSRRALRSM